jgi:hypothetical protein
MNYKQMIDKYNSGTLVDGTETLAELRNLVENIYEQLHYVMSLTVTEDNKSKREQIVNTHYDLIQVRKMVQYRMTKIAAENYRRKNG